MMHSHLAINHLIRQAEEHRSRRNTRDVRPDWLTDLINETAELFEPVTGVARVGFDCQLAECVWEVRMYLGRTESVGGHNDGMFAHTDFCFDLSRLLVRFDSVDELVWTALPQAGCAAAPGQVMIAGTIDSSALRLELSSVPPDEAGPGLRRYPNGECVAV